MIACCVVRLSGYRRRAYALVRAGPVCTTVIDRGSLEKSLFGQAIQFDVALQQKAAHIRGQVRPAGVRRRGRIHMLQGKSALVTGSTSGIGLAIARALA